MISFHPILLIRFRAQYSQIKESSYHRCQRYTVLQSSLFDQGISNSELLYIDLISTEAYNVDTLENHSSMKSTITDNVLMAGQTQFIRTSSATSSVLVGGTSSWYSRTIDINGHELFKDFASIDSEPLMNLGGLPS